jgi:hypothetical protein
MSPFSISIFSYLDVETRLFEGQCEKYFLIN